MFLFVPFYVGKIPQFFAIYLLPRNFLDLRLLFLQLPKIKNSPAQILEMESCLDLLNICLPPCILYPNFVFSQFWHALGELHGSDSSHHYSRRVSSPHFSVSVHSWMNLIALLTFTKFTTKWLVKQGIFAVWFCSSSGK